MTRVPRTKLVAANVQLRVPVSMSEFGVDEQAAEHNERQRDVPQTFVAISLELDVLMSAAAWAAEPGASRLAIFAFAVLLGGYTAHGFVRV